MKQGRTDDSLDRWGAEATKSAPRLTRELEVQLIRAWREGKDPKARDLLVRTNLKRVMKLARLFRRSRRRVPLDDIVSAGCLGLIEAIDHYAPQPEPRFISLAEIWIIGAMNRAASRHERGDGEGLDVDDVVVATTDSVTDEPPNPEDDAIAAERTERAKAQLARAMKKLSPRERTVIESRLLSLEKPDHRPTMASAKALGVSPRRVRMIELTARAKLKRALRSTGGT